MLSISLLLRKPITNPGLLTRTLTVASTHHAKQPSLLPELSNPNSLVSSPPNPKPPKQNNIPLPPRPTLPESTLAEKFLCGSGPGGQKINKTASAVQLTHLPTGIVLKCQATRSRSQNRTIARRLLAEKIEVLERGEESRAKVKEARAVKKKRNGTKKRRRKYMKIAKAKANGDGSIWYDPVIGEVLGAGEDDMDEDEDAGSDSDSDPDSGSDTNSHK